MGKKQHQLRLCVILLTCEQLDVAYGSDSTVEDIFHEVCNIVQLDERELFGLAVRSAEAYLFLDPREKASDIDFDHLSLSGRRCFTKLKRHEKASWFHSTTKSDSVASTDKESNYPTVYFRVRFYIPLHCLRLRSTVSIYYEQLRTNVLEYGILCAPSSYVQLSALALQAEYGNAPVELGSQVSLSSSLPRYFDPTSIYPEKFLREHTQEEIIRMTLLEHAVLRNMSAYTAKFGFIRLASKHSSNFNIHLYSFPKMAQCHFNLWLGIGPEGFLLHQQNKDGWIKYTGLLNWREMKTLSQKDSTLFIHLRERDAIREFRTLHPLTAGHLFAMATHMHFYQATAELSAPHAAGLLREIERGHCEERRIG